jgi:hypothetical protein
MLLAWLGRPVGLPFEVGGGFGVGNRLEPTSNTFGIQYGCEPPVEEVEVVETPDRVIVTVRAERSALWPPLQQLFTCLALRLDQVTLEDPLGDRTVYNGGGWFGVPWPARAAEGSCPEDAVDCYTNSG